MGQPRSRRQGTGVRGQEEKAYTMELDTQH